MHESAPGGATTSPDHIAIPPAQRTTSGLLGAALRAFVVASAGLLFAWPPAEFVMLYAVQLGLAMVVTAPMMFAADRKTMPVRGGLGELALVAAVLAVFWLVTVFVPFTAIWVLPVVAPGQALFPGVFALGALDWVELALPLAILAGMALARGLSYSRAAQAGRAPDLKQPFLHRAICIGAFVFFGPGIYTVLLSGDALGLPVSPAIAIVLTYACCEAYPLVAAAIDHPRRTGPQ